MLKIRRLKKKKKRNTMISCYLGVWESLFYITLIKCTDKERWYVKSENLRTLLKY